MASGEGSERECGTRQSRLNSLCHSPTQRGHISFEGVSLRYRPDLPLVLRNFSAIVFPGEKIGVVGRTGSGKSTLLTTLFRLVEFEAGRICIDGVDIATVPVEHLRSSLSIIPQVVGQGEGV